MYEKDYLLRMIEMLGDLIRALVGYIARGDYQQAREKLTEAYITFLRKDASFFINIPTVDLTTRLLAEHNYTNSHLEILAELFHAEAMLLEAEGKPADSLSYYEKALRLFTFTDETSRTYSDERIRKIAQIRDRITDLHKTQSLQQ